MADESTPTRETPSIGEDEAQAPWYRLLFGVRRSVRYHNRRTRFYDAIHRWKNWLSLMFGSGAMAAIWAQSPPLLPALAALFITALSGVDLGIGTALKGRLHVDLARRFLELERAMTLVKSPTVEEVREYTAKRLFIEADEPPPLRILDALCHNEVMLALGHEQDELYYVSWPMRMQANFRSMSAEGLQTIRAHRTSIQTKSK